MSEFTKFDYLLNSLEAAARKDRPGDHGYGDKRRALFAYVRAQEAVARAAKDLMRPGGIIPITPGIHDFTDVHALRAALSNLGKLT